MKFKSILATALAAVVALSSCSKEENGVTPDGGSADAKFSLSFILPTNVGTRAGEDVATPGESKVTSIEVFAYSSAGAVRKLYTVSSDFDKDETNATTTGTKYTLKSTADPVSTSAVTNTIYIGINTNIGEVSENVLLGKIADVSALTTGTDGFIMFSDAKSADLDNVDKNKVDGVGADYINVVELDVIRVAAKVTVTEKEASSGLTATFDNDATTPVSITYAIQKYGIYQAPSSSYLAPRYNNDTPKKYITYSTVDAFNPAGVNLDVKANSAGLGNWVCTYTTESRQDVPSYGNTSYAYIRTAATVNRSAKLDGNAIVWDATAANFGGGVADSDIHFFMWEGKTYLANAAEWAIIEASSLAGDISSHYVYYDGYAYFRVWLGTAANPYQIARNQFMNIAVTKVNADLGEFPGFPGTETDPTKPIDPTDPTEPNNPDPTKPTDPIVPENALLEVEVTVKNWNYTEVGTELN